jgi:dihydroorotate dehydrogenase
MPDWSYHPLFRPVLFRLPGETARRITIGLLATQTRLPGGKPIFRALASGRAPGAVRTNFMGLEFPSPVGLGSGIDVDGSAAPLMHELGFGFVELGPAGATFQQMSPLRKPRRVRAMHGLATSGARGAPGADQISMKASSLTIPVGIHLRGDRVVEAIEAVQARVAFITLNAGVGESRSLLREVRAATEGRLLIRVLAGWDRVNVDRVVENARLCGVDGIVVVAGADYPALVEGELVWHGALPRALSFVAEIGEHVPVALAGGILTPVDAEAALEAGAGLLFLSDGLVFAGPGLPKRINRHLARSGSATRPDEAKADLHQPSYAGSIERAENELPVRGSLVASEALAEGGLGAAQVGSAQPVGSLAAITLPRTSLRSESAGIRFLLVASIATLLSGLAYLLLAATAVLLPHETGHLGMSTSHLCSIDDCRLVDFMAHGRACYGGVLVGVGIMFCWLTVGHLGRHEPWAWWTLLSSGLVVFGSFLSFLAYDYLDTWHGALTLAISIVWLAGLVLARPHLRGVGGFRAAFREPGARAWLWSPGGRGRIMIGMFAAGLSLAGVSILAIAGSDVFVPQDLAFIRLDPNDLVAINERLIPVMAHDRAGFGGGLLALGILFGATAWKGIRRNSLGAWRALGLAGFSLMIPAFLAHAFIGYIDPIHLFPVYSGAVLLVIALVTLRPHMSTGTYETDHFPDV